MSAEKKAYFLRNDLLRLLTQIDPATKGNWGKMNVAQMVEHMSDAFRQANGKLKYDQTVTKEEYIPKMQDFIMSDKPFKANTVNSMLPEEPAPAKHQDINDAYIELSEEISAFFDVFDKDPDMRVLNPIFGKLSYEQWVHLLYKHSLHHLKQFGADIDPITLT